MASSSSSSHEHSSLPPTLVGPHKILTPRLLIRTPTPADLPGLLDYFNYGNLLASAEEPRKDLLTEDVLRKRMDKWEETRGRGENGWLVVLLRDGRGEKEEGGKVIGFGGYNSFPRTRILNSGERRSENVPEEGKVLAGDIGVGIDVREQRKGYAREALCGMIQHAFSNLQCKYIHLDTQHDNQAFRAVMKDMGIPEKEGNGVDYGEEDMVFGFAWKSLNYDFDEGMWAGIKGGLEGRGKWLL